MWGKTDAEFSRDTLLAPPSIMAANGVPLQTVVDVGCADGTVSLAVLDSVGPGLNVLSIDAQATYEPSLQRIHTLLGEPYRITALSDHVGTISVNCPQHASWMSTVLGSDHVIAIPVLSGIHCETLRLSRV